MTTQDTLAHTLEQFLDSDDFAEAVITSTHAGFAGNGCSVELFIDGTWRVLPADTIGRLYQSPGHVLSIPQLNKEDYLELADGAEDDTVQAIAGELRMWNDGLREIAQQMREALLFDQEREAMGASDVRTTS